MTDKDAALEWARKVIKSKPPRYTDASRNAAAVILADAEIIKAADELAKAVEECLPYVEDMTCGHVARDALAAYRAAVSERDT